MYKASLTDYMAQSRAASELMAEYLRCLEVIGIRLGEGAGFDEIVCTSQQAKSAMHIFHKLCEERGLTVKES